MRLPRLTKRNVIAAITFIIISIIVQFMPLQKKEIQQNNPLAMVTKAIDGDTIELENGQRVRYIGINAPEILYPNKPNECFALESKEENKILVEGKMVRLKKDVSNTDKYGRLLRYVFLDNSSSTEAIFINKYLMTEGFTKTMTVPPNLKYYSLFKEEQIKAKENKKGLWNQCL